MASKAWVRGERCPVTGAQDVYVDGDGFFVCESSGVRWERPNGRKVDAESVQAFHARGASDGSHERAAANGVGIDFASDEAAEAAAGLTADDFDGVEASGATGYTVVDVRSIHSAKEGGTDGGTSEGDEGTDE